MVTYYPGQTDLDTLIGRIRNLGYDAQPKQSEEDQATRKQQELKHKRNKLIISTILSLPLLMTMLVHLFNMHLPDILMNPWFHLSLRHQSNLSLVGNFMLALIRTCATVALIWMCSLH